MSCFWGWARSPGPSKHVFSVNTPTQYALAFSDQPEQAFSEWLTKQHGVATIPVASFYTDKVDQGICFAKREGTLEKAIERLMTIK